MRLENDELLIDNDGMLLDRNATNIYIYIYIYTHNMRLGRLSSCVIIMKK